MSDGIECGWSGGVWMPPDTPPPGYPGAEEFDELDGIADDNDVGLVFRNEHRPGAAVVFSLVPDLTGTRRKPTAADPSLYKTSPTDREEWALRLRFLAESRCALNVDPESGACDLRCPDCGCRGAWQDERTGRGALVEPDACDVDCEPYTGRKRASSGYWRCTRGHETREPLRPRKEPRGGGSHGRRPATGRNAVEDRLVLLCSSGG